MIIILIIIAHGMLLQFHAERSVFDSPVWKNGTGPRELGPLGGSFDIKISHDSGIQAPPFEMLRFECIRTDRRSRGIRGLDPSRFLF